MQTAGKQPNRTNRPDEPSLLTKCVATVLFSGYSPVAPGTAGSIVALIPLIVFPGISKLTLALLITMGFIAGVWSSRRFEKAYGDDPQVVVIDESVGMWVTMMFIPISWMNIVIGFILFRTFDIIKPPPARQLENLRNGWGIMLDDVAAGIYAGIIVFIINLLW